MPDQPPTARIEAAGADSGMVQRDEVLALVAQAGDDVRLKRVDLVVLNHEAQAAARTLFPAKPALPRTGIASDREIEVALNYDLDGTEPADRRNEAQFLVVATDVRDQTTRSEPVSVIIGSSDKAIEARMAARLKENSSRTWTPNSITSGRPAPRGCPSAETTRRRTPPPKAPPCFCSRAA